MPMSRRLVSGGSTSEFPVIECKIPGHGNLVFIVYSLGVAVLRTLS
jgi:hypothetical protein